MQYLIIYIGILINNILNPIYKLFIIGFKHSSKYSRWSGNGIMVGSVSKLTGNQATVMFSGRSSQNVNSVDSGICATKKICSSDLAPRLAHLDSSTLNL